MKSNPKYLLLLTGAPASGKTYLSHQLASKFTALSINHKIFSTDNLQAFLSHHQNFEHQNIQLFFSSYQWDLQLRQFKLNKQKFDEKAWNFSRKVAESFEILDLLFLNCQILIIQDELPLKSQRKPFKKYCSEKAIKFLEIQMQATLEEAIQNNQKRGQQSEKQKVSNQVIKKSFQKYESSPDALILTKQTFSELLNQKDLLSNFKTVQIHDNHAEYLNKKNILHEYAQKEMDQNEVRKLITKIMKDETVALQYFLAGQQTKKKAYILAECKKIYIQQKRKVAFKEILQSYMLKNKAKQSKQQEIDDPKHKQDNNPKQQNY